jgi:hypothetical protein
LITGLQQRLLSSVEAFARTLRVHRRTVKRQWREAQADPDDTPLRTGQFDLQTSSVDSDDDRASLAEEELQAEEEAQFKQASAATLGPISDLSARDLFAREQQLLDDMTEIAEATCGLPDARVKKLIAWVRQHMCPDLGTPGASWNDTRVLIFSEYDDTKRYLKQQLDAALADSDRAE